MERHNINKKGQLSDMMFVLLTLTSIAITMLVAGYIYGQINTGFDEAVDIQTNESRDAYDAFEVAFGMFDTGYAFILIGLIIGLLISSFAIPTHPIFLIINIFGFLILVFMGAVFGNLYLELIAQPGLSATATAYYPIMTFIVTKLPWIGAILVFLSSIIMYAKGREE